MVTVPCIFKCDAPGCTLVQEGAMVYTGKRILEMFSVVQTFEFQFRRDYTLLDWKEVGRRGRFACCAECGKAVQALEAADDAREVAEYQSKEGKKRG